MKTTIFFYLAFFTFPLFSMEHQFKQQCAKIVIDSEFAAETTKTSPKALVTLAGEAIYKKYYEHNQDLTLNVLHSLPDVVASHVANNCNAVGNTLLHVYASLGRTEEIAYLLKIGLAPRKRNLANETPLIIAGKNKHLDAFAIIFSNGGYHWNDASKFKAIKAFVRMPEENAFIFFKNEMVNANIFHGDIHVKGPNPYLLAFSALQGGHFKFLKYLLNRAHDSNELSSITSHFKKPFLHVAAKMGLERHLALLIKKSYFSINELDKEGYTPADYAAEKGYIPCLALLLSHGANLNSPLNSAVIGNQLEVVKYLLKKGADVNIEDKWGHVAIRNAMRHNNIEMVQLLLSCENININHRSIELYSTTSPEIVELIENRRKSQKE